MDDLKATSGLWTCRRGQVPRSSYGDNLRNGLELELSDQILSGNTLHSCPVLMEPYLLPQE